MGQIVLAEQRVQQRLHSSKEEQQAQKSARQLLPALPAAASVPSSPATERRRAHQRTLMTEAARAVSKFEERVAAKGRTHATTHRRFIVVLLDTIITIYFI